MNHTRDNERILEQQVEQVDFAMRHALTVFIDAGYSPSAITGGLITTIFNVMKAQDLSPMQISNEMNKLADGVREMAFIENKKLNS